MQAFYLSDLVSVQLQFPQVLQTKPHLLKNSHRQSELQWERSVWKRGPHKNPTFSPSIIPMIFTLIHIFFIQAVNCVKSSSIQTPADFPVHKKTCLIFAPLQPGSRALYGVSWCPVFRKRIFA